MSLYQSLFIQEVDTNGCAPYERDTDSDGVVDSLDNCPTQAKGVDGYTDGCPLEKQTDTLFCWPNSRAINNLVYRHSGCYRIVVSFDNYA